MADHVMIHSRAALLCYTCEALGAKAFGSIHIVYHLVSTVQHEVKYEV